MAETLRGRRIVLTGASRGLGRALARAFAREGAELLLVARNATDLASLAAELAPARAEWLALDLAAPDAAERVFAGDWAAVDVLVNNAAIQGPIGRFWETGLEDWRAAIETDLMAPAALCHRAVPLMIRRGGGVIVNLSGGGAASARPRFTAYAAAKTALVRFTECLAAETADYGIAVVAVAPGALPTAMAGAILAAGEARAGPAEMEAAGRAAAQDDEAMAEAVALCLHLAERPRPALSGRLIAALWDPWRTLDPSGELYTLRRVVPP